MLRPLAGGLAILCAGAVLLSAPRDLPAQAGSEPVSRIPITFKTPWPALVALAESAIPKCSGQSPQCQGSAENYLVYQEDDWFVVATILGRDIGMKGSAWRIDPLEFSLTNGELRSSLNILYRAKVGFLAREDATQSCGYDEPAREVMVGAGGKIAFSPDWYVDFTFKPVLRPEVSCGNIFERVDVAKWSAPVIDRAMEATTEKVRDVVRAQTKIRDEAAQVWAKLQEPISIGPVAWLDIRPYAAFANVPEVTDDGQYLTMKAGLEARPRLVVGARPAAGTAPLPPLTGTDQGPGFNINLNALLEYGKMTRILRQKLVGQTFTAGESWPARRLRATVRDVQVQPTGQRVLLSVAVTGFFRGTLHLTGRPVFRDRGRLQGNIVIRDIDFTVQTRNLLVRLLANRVFQNRIRRALEANAVFDISSELAAAYEHINQGLNSELTPHARLVGNLTQFGPGRISVRRSGIDAAYRVGGQVAVVVDPF